MVKKKTKKRKSSRAADVPDYRKIKRKIKAVDDFVVEGNAVLYGPPGTGKTTLGGTWPGPVLFIDCKERGTDSIRDMEGVDVLRADEWQDVDDIYWYLKKEAHKYKTVVMDTVSQAQDLSVRKIMEDKGQDYEEGALGNWGTMTKSDWGTNATRMKTMILQFRDLPMNVVFIAHDRMFGGEEEDDENIISPSMGPRLSPSVATVLNGAVNVIGSTFIRERTVKKKVGKGKKMRTKEIRRIEYGLRLGPHAHYITKIRKPKRIELPSVLVNPSYKKIVAIINEKPEK